MTCHNFRETKHNHSLSTYYFISMPQTFFLLFRQIIMQMENCIPLYDVLQHMFSIRLNPPDERSKLYFHVLVFSNILQATLENKYIAKPQETQFEELSVLLSLYRTVMWSVIGLNHRLAASSNCTLISWYPWLFSSQRCVIYPLPHWSIVDVFMMCAWLHCSWAQLQLKQANPFHGLHPDLKQKPPALLTWR